MNSRRETKDIGNNQIHVFVCVDLFFVYQLSAKCNVEISKISEKNAEQNK